MLKVVRIITVYCIMCLCGGGGGGGGVSLCVGWVGVGGRVRRGSVCVGGGGPDRRRCPRRCSPSPGHSPAVLRSGRSTAEEDNDTGGKTLSEKTSFFQLSQVREKPRIGQDWLLRDFESWHNHHRLLYYVFVVG